MGSVFYGHCDDVGREKQRPVNAGWCVYSGQEQQNSVMGYNGMPAGCDDDTMPWGKSGAPLDNKYFYVCHAELNSILNYRGGNLKDAIIYSTLFPCNECAKAIIQCGIKEVVYMSDKYAMTESTIASKKMFDMAGVAYRPFEAKGRKITLNL